MQKKLAITVKIFALSIASLVAVLSMLRAAAWSVDAGTLLFLLWAVSPYIIFLVITYLVERFTSIHKIHQIAWVISLLMLGFTLLAYVGTIGDTSSTYALIYIFVPIWLYIGSLGLLALSVLISWVASRNNAQ